MLGAKAHAAVPSEYSSIVSSKVLVRPIRSATWPKIIPPAAQPSSSTDVRMPVQLSVAAEASGVPRCSPSSAGTAFGAM